jgi:ADP-heptose:LPS heptosyltransferase
MPIRKWLMLILKINLLNKSHTVDRHFAAVEGLGVDNDGVGLDLFLDDQVDLPVSEDISDHIVINAGASKVTKRVPRALIEGIIKSSKRKYMLIGGKDVAEEYKGFDKTNCINLIDQLSLEQSFRIISECHLLITGDTAMMHAAAALQKPQIVVWGSTSDDFGFYPYYGCDRTDLSHHIIKGLDCQPCSKMGRVSCPKGHMNCLTNIEAKEVLLKIKKITSD